MATHRLPILGWGTRPDDTGECFFEPYDVLATNDVWDRLIARFGSSNSAAPTVRHGLHGGFTVPKNYVGTAVLVIVWTATVTGDNVVWDFEYRAVGGSDSESLDQSGTQESVTVTTGTGEPSAAHERMETTISLTSSNFAVDDEVTFFFARDGADGADDKAGSALLFNLLFQFSDA
jgi:hypothetical protein